MKFNYQIPNSKKLAGLYRRIDYGLLTLEELNELIPEVVVPLTIINDVQCAMDMKTACPYYVYHTDQGSFRFERVQDSITVIRL